MRYPVLALLCVLALTGCGTTSSVGVSGNGTCHPSQDLPAHKTIKKVPEVDTPLEDLWALFAAERKEHGQDVRDYNSLYKTCVTGVLKTE